MEQMKRYILYILCLICSWHAGAQTVELIDSTDYALVHYSFPVQKPRSAYSLTYIPMLCGENDTLQLNKVIVRGRDNAKIVHRDYVLNKRRGSEPQYIRARTVNDSTMISDSLTLSIDDYRWIFLDSVSLRVKIVQEGCCNIEQLSDLLASAGAPLQQLEIIQKPLYESDTISALDTIKPDTPKVVEPPFVPTFAEIDEFEPDKFAAELVKNNPVAIQFKDYKPYDRTVVLAKDSGALYVHFQLDKVVLLREFSNNAATLDRIMYMINALMEDTTTSVKVIQIIGLASIEGNIPHNEWLATNRAMALENYIKARIDTTGIMFEATGGGEAWAEFRWLAEQQQFEGKQRVLDIVDKDPDLNSRERWLKTLNNGRTWAYIKQHILPPLRNSGYVKVYYDVKPDKKGIIINEGAQMLREERYQVALNKLLQVQDDLRAQNALGTAYYMTGDRVNAIRCWRLAAANGDEDALRNLQHVLAEGDI